jgi:hypothetical protein
MQRFTSAIALSVAAGLALSSAFIALAHTSSQGLAASHSTAALGMVLYRDPVTGAFGVPPPGALEAPSAPSPSDLSRSQGGWRETADPRPGAGWKLEGPGMFTTMTATVGADGKVSVDCDRAERGASR